MVASLAVRGSKALGVILGARLTRETRCTGRASREPWTHVQHRPNPDEGKTHSPVPPH
jgi:hypothetical protein